MKAFRKHPQQIQLALFAGKELGWWESSSVARHLMGCSVCRKQVAAFSQDRQEVKDIAAELPPEIDWNRLADEMEGNIRVGLAAGEAIAAFDRPSGFVTARVKPTWLRWNAGWALTFASLAFALAFWLNLPAPQAEHLIASLHKIRFERIFNRVVADPGTVLTDEALGEAGSQTSQTMVQASRASVQVWENGGSLSFLHPRSDGLTLSVNMQGSAGARYIDSDTGLVTINRVYYAQQ